MLSRNTRVFVSLLCITAVGVFSRSPWVLSVYRDYFPPQNASLCACDKCLMDYEPWFSEIMSKSPEPLMTPENNISAETYKWWQHTQFERLNFTFYNETVEKLFETFPRCPRLPESDPGRCRTCALVGNSGNLKGSHYGPLIDFHDIVIRINRGFVKGFEKDVGTKTTHRAAFPLSTTALDNTTHLLLFPFKTIDLLWLIKTFAPRPNKTLGTRFIANKDKVMIVNPAFMKYVHYVWLKRRGSYPSTGFMTLIVSMHMCDKVSLFGFGADRHGSWNHYYEVTKKKNFKTGHHNGKNEYAAIQKLHELQKIFLYKGGRPKMSKSIPPPRLH